MYRVGQRTTYEPVSKCYRNIITINEMPSRVSPMSALIRQTSFSPLSPFDRGTACSQMRNCGYAFYNPLTNAALTVDDSTYLINVIISSGYEIDYKLTKLMRGLGGSEDNLLFYVTEK